MRALAAAAAAGVLAATVLAVPMLAVAVLGCGGAKPAEPMPGVAEKAHPVTPVHLGPGFGRFYRIPRPVIAIADPRPDLTEEPRWPLTIMQHPALEPQFNVAGALADPGISWTELCARGVQHRHDPSRQDELAYLGGWCAAEQHDVELAVRELAPLMRSPVPGIANGAPVDMVNVLVESEDADHATQILADQQLRDPHLWDLLAAAYFEVGKNDDALSVTTTAMQLDPTPAPAATCHRLARALLLGPESLRQLLLEQLAGMTRDPRHVDPTCEYLAAAVPCAVESECRKYYANEHLHGDEVYIALLYNRWSGQRDWSGWIDYAWEARRMLAANGAQELTFAAIDAAVITSDCKDVALASLATDVDAMAVGMSGTYKTWIQPKVSWVHALSDDHAKCAAFQAQWLAAHPQ